MPPRLPRDLCAALEALESDTVLRAAVGESFCAEFIRLKYLEWDEYNTQITGWEHARYADGF